MYPMDMLTPRMFRAARMMTGLTLADFAAKSGVSPHTLRAFERNADHITKRDKSRLREQEEAVVSFLANQGVIIVSDADASPAGRVAGAARAAGVHALEVLPGGSVVSLRPPHDGGV